jgi:hypothetical protein
MKFTLSLVFLIAFGTAIAQTESTAPTNNGGVVNNTSLVSASNGMKSSYGASAYFVNPARAVDGTVYLFDNWKNAGVIYATTNQRFALNNINLNIERNSFESKVGKDSLFSFNFNNIEKFVINGRTFKNYYWNDDNRVYEIIYEGQQWSIIKGFKIVEVTGSANPMLNRTRDRIVRKMFYYIKDDKGIHPFRLKKNKILKLLNADDAKAEKIKNFAKMNDLSFKKENDVRKIIEYSRKN